eukprot:31028-Pelagococcus_subviridis.AAC.3
MAPPMNVHRIENIRSALVCGITSPYPNVDNVATAQYNDARYSVPSGIVVVVPSLCMESKYDVTQDTSRSSSQVMQYHTHAIQCARKRMKKENL